jgi:hypothetical protein
MTDRPEWLSDKAQTTPAEKAKAVATFQQWADDESDMKRKVSDVFNDRRKSATPQGGEPGLTSL